MVDQGLGNQQDKLEEEHVVKGELHHSLGKYERHWAMAYCQAACIWGGLNST